MQVAAATVVIATLWGNMENLPQKKEEKNSQKSEKWQKAMLICLNATLALSLSLPLSLYPLSIPALPYNFRNSFVKLIL